MSYVTTAILTTKVLDNHLREKLALGYEDDSSRVVNFIEPEERFWENATGTKGVEAAVMVGGFNYLDRDKLVHWLGSLVWVYPAMLVLISEDGRIVAVQYGDQ